jgi:uncharacterized repeat protein (TIGR01451 family)
VVYHDANGNGEIDASDPVVDDLSDIAGGLDPGESLSLLVKVFAPAGADAGDANTTTVSVALATDGDATNDSATDATNVVSGDISLVKRQALDADCDPNTAPDVAFTTAQIPASAGAVPGACITYQITAANTGSTSVNGVVIRDAPPTYTTYTDCGGGASDCSASGSSVATPAVGGTGPITDTVGAMDPGDTAVLTFTVKIDQ